MIDKIDLNVNPIFRKSIMKLANTYKPNFSLDVKEFEKCYFLKFQSLYVKTFLNNYILYCLMIYLTLFTNSTKMNSKNLISEP